MRSRLIAGSVLAGAGGLAVLMGGLVALLATGYGDPPGPSNRGLTLAGLAVVVVGLAVLAVGIILILKSYAQIERNRRPSTF